MARNSLIHCCLLLFTVAWPSASWADIKFYERNDIRLLDNRFRIDGAIEEVTFVIKRLPRSPAVVLVRPDGSKLYVNRHDDSVQWLEGDTFDIITMKNPMPGPWQAVGRIDPENAIRVVSPLQLEMRAFPLRLYSREKIKMVTALINREGKAINDDYFEDLSITLTLSTLNRKEDDNFAYNETFTQVFKDDGKGHDEHKADGLLTAYPHIDVPAGKYRVEVTTKNEVFARAFRQEILVYPNPVKLTILDENQDEGVVFQFNIDSEEVIPESVIVDGLYEGVLEDSIQYSGQGQAGQNKFDIVIPQPSSAGKYSVEGQIFATTINGREIVLELEEQSFRVVPPEPSMAPTPDSQPELEPEEPESNLALYLGIAGGLFILIAVVLGGLIWWKKRSVQRVLQQQEVEGEATEVSTPEEELKID
ncbi:TIGR03503 family protein [Motilimonas pumila]|uniref:TIGR03503 family protein n=1 Tax=Motilimonas pumila TaxID=2303987 RepID=A0A418YBB9_9GAMM|nr:TIGR03503 family protein [Motilimonas pumila]RJG40237.1 TIGR03503 family protein [Motilimonas pumila]